MTRSWQSCRPKSEVLLRCSSTDKNIVRQAIARSIIQLSSRSQNWLSPASDESLSSVEKHTSSMDTLIVWARRSAHNSAPYLNDNSIQIQDLFMGTKSLPWLIVRLDRLELRFHTLLRRKLHARHDLHKRFFQSEPNRPLTFLQPHSSRLGLQFLC